MTMPSKPFSIIVWTLFVSVLLNLFLVAGGLSFISAGKHRPFGPMALEAPHGEYMVGWMARHLEPADANAFRDAFKGQTDALKQAHEQVRQAMGTVATVFQQEQPDPAALQAALENLNQARSETHNIADKILQAAYTKLSPDGRHRLSELSRGAL